MKTSVLIVDDSLTVRMDLDESFRAADFVTTLCGNAEAAREALQRSLFSLIVLDVILPDADGIELLKEFKTWPLSANTPVMLLSTEAEVRDRIRGIKTGADAYVGKPYDSAYVVSKARELIRKGLPQENLQRPLLLVDDSPSFREALQVALEATGYNVVTAKSGEEALQKAAAISPRALIIDAGLPGIDGFTVLRRLREDTSLGRIPCLLLTASDEPGSEMKALDLGADAFVRKSGDLEIILTRLAALLRSSTPFWERSEVSSFLSSKKILAVDDSPTYLHQLAEQLLGEGYEPILARSGEEALELMAVENVNCVLLDLGMPGLSGQQTCQRIKNSPGWREIPVIILTAREDREAMIEGINAGADDYIPKSGDFEVLLARLRAQLRRKQFEDENRRIRQQLLQKELEASEARASRELSEVRGKLLAELEEKNRELEAFSYSVSHDLRAPLRAMEGFTRILLEDHASSLNAEGNRILNIVVTNARKMGRLIDDLLRFFRLGRVSLQNSQIDMSALAGSVAAEVLEAHPARRIELEIGTLPEAEGDASLLRQVFHNLIANAVKYSAPRDPARIELSGEEKDTLKIYRVRDNGVGFKMEYATKLFGVFQRLHSDAQFEGTGVGLALVKRIVERHGGSLQAEAEEGKGATFSFTLPGKDAHVPGAE